MISLVSHLMSIRVSKVEHFYMWNLRRDLSRIGGKNQNAPQPVAEDLVVFSFATILEFESQSSFLQRSHGDGSIQKELPRKFMFS